jgi:hypothetical protein
VAGARRLATAPARRTGEAPDRDAHGVAGRMERSSGPRAHARAARAQPCLLMVDPEGVAVQILAGQHLSENRSRLALLPPLPPGQHDSSGQRCGT